MKKYMSVDTEIKNEEGIMEKWKPIDFGFEPTAYYKAKKVDKEIVTLQAEIVECKKRVNNYRLSCNELESENDKVVDMLEIVLYEYEEDMKIRHQEQIAGLIEKRRSR